MNTRRVRRVAAVGALFLLMVNRRVEAYDPTQTDIEFEGHGGTSSGQVPVHQGGCLFAPTTGIRYGGGGARVRFRPQGTPQQPRHGTEFAVQGAVEYQSFETLAEGSGGSREAPESQVFGGGGATVGYNWRWVGVRAGSLVFNRIPRASLQCASGEPYRENCPARAQYDSPEVTVWPDAQVRIGPLDTVHGEVGIGAYNLATVLRPGAYLGLAWANPNGWGVAAHVGVHNTFGNQAHVRGDLAVTVPVHSNFRVTAGGAVSSGETDRVEPEGRLAGEVRF